MNEQNSNRGEINLNRAQQKIAELIAQAQLGITRLMDKLGLTHSGKDTEVVRESVNITIGHLLTITDGDMFDRGIVRLQAFSSDQDETRAQLFLDREAGLQRLFSWDETYYSPQGESEIPDLALLQLKTYPDEVSNPTFIPEIQPGSRVTLYDNREVVFVGTVDGITLAEKGTYFVINNRS